MRDAKEEEKAPSLNQSVAIGHEIERAFYMQRNRPKDCLWQRAVDSSKRRLVRVRMEAKENERKKNPRGEVCQVADDRRKRSRLRHATRKWLESSTRN